MKYLFLLLGLGCCGLLAAQTPERYSEVRIDLQGHTMTELGRLGIETDHGEWLPPFNRFTTVLSAAELQRVQQAGFSTQLRVADLQEDYLEKRRHPATDRGGACNPPGQAYPTPANYTYGSMGGYHTYAEMLAVLDDMHAKFPGLISVRKAVSDTLLTYEGRPLWYVKISDHADQQESQPAVLYTALHHAREPNGLSQMLFYMWYLLEHYATDAEVRSIVDQNELYFIPCVNPDGYVYNETTNPAGGGFWRKNRRDNGDGTFGVDLNRNYGFQWGLTDAGSSPNTVSETYRGPGPFSEPESRMLRDFEAAHDFRTMNNYHTFGNHMLYPWAYNDSPADSTFIKLARLYTRENHYRIGTPIQTVGYPVNGDANDWAYSSGGAYAFTTEIGKTGFWPQPEEIDALNRDNMWPNLALALTAGRYGELEDRSANQAVLQPGAILPFRVTRYGLEDGPLTAGIVPFSANVISLPATQAFTLAQFQSADFNYELELQPGVQPGDEFVLLMQLSNGNYTRTDTLRKVYGGQTVTAFSDPGSDLNHWTGDWGTSTQYFVSPPTSITDSPNGPYEPYTLSALVALAPIAIPAYVTAPQLRFWARWELEEDFDYVEVQGVDTDGSVTPLCGRFTEAGTPDQNNSPSVIDGYQYDWVQECMDLSAFKGRAFYPIFILNSDPQDEYDGFYLDDVQVVYQDSIVGTQVVLSVYNFRLRQNQPNPVDDLTRIAWEGEIAGNGMAELFIYNALGERVGMQTLSLSTAKEVQIDTRRWPNGVYTYLIRTPEGQALPRKMTVLHR